MSNAKQIGVGLVAYANDQGADLGVRAQQPAPVLALAPANAPADERLEPRCSVPRAVPCQHRQYFPCLTNKRRNIANLTTPARSQLEHAGVAAQRAMFNEFLTKRSFNHYTMATGASGVWTDSDRPVAWDRSCRTRVSTAARPSVPNPNDLVMRGVPCTSRKTQVVNCNTPTACSATGNQLTHRHGGRKLGWSCGLFERRG